MKPIEGTRGLRRALPAGIGALATLLVSGLSTTSARADMVLLSDTTLVTGQESAVFSFTTPGPGTVTAQLTNLDWPQPLSGLSFEAGSANNVMASWSNAAQAGAGTQVLNFQVARGGTYFADVTATPGGSLGLGVYSFTLNFSNGPSVVPLPASVWLLAPALIVLLGVLRSRRGRRPIEQLEQHGVWLLAPALIVLLGVPRSRRGRRPIEHLQQHPVH